MNAVSDFFLVKSLYLDLIVQCHNKFHSRSISFRWIFFNDAFSRGIFFSLFLISISFHRLYCSGMLFQIGSLFLLNLLYLWMLYTRPYFCCCRRSFDDSFTSAIYLLHKFPSDTLTDERKIILLKLLCTSVPTPLMQSHVTAF